MMAQRRANQYLIAAAAWGDSPRLSAGPGSRTSMPALRQR
jgi:hypothetical protein